MIKLRRSNFWLSQFKWAYFWSGSDIQPKHEPAIINAVYHKIEFFLCIKPKPFFFVEIVSQLKSNECSVFKTQILNTDIRSLKLGLFKKNIIKILSKLEN